MESSPWRRDRHHGEENNQQKQKKTWLWHNTFRTKTHGVGITHSHKKRGEGEPTQKQKTHFTCVFCEKKTREKGDQHIAGNRKIVDVRLDRGQQQKNKQKLKRALNKINNEWGV